ncbi:NUDIX domain-containing protein [Sulfitobacter delicatus]|uniref:ADP-ribose pyrophosphatase YjhB, NUDIX family n=1 Tax=Sulfitobacter delicatus TaxID=218672 RepID=A0A1G7MR44_9RHOB|nr:NUDIX domain-containing protein [Sulfitobacter delicatus]SDF64131.1 ADP-ribose pyrophosphatase YjhB, NUDIX family [Sulfitobacter delicatus]
MPLSCPRLAARAVLVHQDRLLLVNAYADNRLGLMCAPGGGVEAGASLPDNLMREVYEETGLQVTVGAPCLVNEFHDPGGDFHQVDIYFRCALSGSAEVDPHWLDSEAVVTRHMWVTRDELAQVPHKPDSLGDVAFGGDGVITYDPLEPILR